MFILFSGLSYKLVIQHLAVGSESIPESRESSPLQLAYGFNRSDASYDGHQKYDHLLECACQAMSMLVPVPCTCHLHAMALSRH